MRERRGWSGRGCRRAATWTTLSRCLLAGIPFWPFVDRYGTSAPPSAGPLAWLAFAGSLAHWLARGLDRNADCVRPVKRPPFLFERERQKGAKKGKPSTPPCQWQPRLHFSALSRQPRTSTIGMGRANNGQERRGRFFHSFNPQHGPVSEQASSRRATKHSLSSVPASYTCRVG